MSMQGNKVVLPIEITLRGKEELDDALDKARETNRLSKENKELQKDDAAFKESLELASAQATAEAAGGLGEDFDIEFEKTGLGKLKDILKTNPLDESGFRNVFNFARDPSGALLGLIQTNLPIIAGLFVAYGLAEQIWEKLTQRGGLVDLTFKRLLSEEFNPFRSRELRQQIRLGQRQLIFVSDAGEPFTPDETFNSLELVRNKQIFEMDIYRVRHGSTF